MSWMKGARLLIVRLNFYRPSSGRIAELWEPIYLSITANNNSKVNKTDYMPLIYGWGVMCTIIRIKSEKTAYIN